MTRATLYRPDGSVIPPSPENNTRGGIEFSTEVNFLELKVFKTRPVKLKITGQVPIGAEKLGLFIEMPFIDGRVFRAGPIIVDLNRPKEAEDEPNAARPGRTVAGEDEGRESAADGAGPAGAAAGEREPGHGDADPGAHGLQG